MDDTPREHLSELVRSLTDVELAVLLCLVADRACIVTTEHDHLSRLETEVELVATRTFGLETNTVLCTPETTLEEFVGALMLDAPSPGAITPLEPAGSSFPKYAPSPLPLQGDPAEALLAGRKRIADVVIIRNLDRASVEIQAQVLELMRTRRIVTKRVTLRAPERFLIVALLEKMHSQPALLSHLREQFFISHYHSPPEDDDGYEDSLLHYPSQSDADSFASVVIRKQPPPPLAGSSQSQQQHSATTTTAAHYHNHPPIPYSAIGAIGALAADVSVSTEIRRYLLDIIVFLRMHRAVRGGVTAQATVDFELLVKCLAPLHDLDFATPALVSLAVFKVYSHRITLAQTSADDRSMLWGSNADAVDAYLAQVDVEAVIEEVLANVKAPL